MIDTQVIIDELLPALHSDSRANLTFWGEADLIQWIDEAVKRLARVAMMFVERNASITTAPGTATYSLPARHLATVHVSYGSAALRPSTMLEMEARDPAFQATAGAPSHWYEQNLGMATVGVAKVPAASASLPVIMSAAPPDVDVAKSNTTVEAPGPVSGYLAFSVLAAAYGRESETEQPDLAKHAAARMSLYEQLFTKYYGAGV